MTMLPLERLSALVVVVPEVRLSRSVLVAAAQLGPVTAAESRPAVVSRLVQLLREAAGRRAELVVFPEAALTPFFPHWSVADEQELDSYFEDAMPNAGVQPLFDEAARLGVGFCLGYAERVVEEPRVRRFNTSVLVERDGRIVGTYRKIHLPGYREPDPSHPFQNLEKRYFEVGDLGFPVWDAFDGRVGMCICNDRRWPETYRVMGLQGVELVLLGYNTPVHNPAMPQTDSLADFHNRLSMQAGAYQNGTWVVGVAKAGLEEGVRQIGGSCVVAPSGEIVAQATTDGDEVITAQCDLDQCRSYKEHIFNFAAHRRPEHYWAIAAPH
jgi:predicted amidohydrolase